MTASPRHREREHLDPFAAPIPRPRHRRRPKPSQRITAAHWVGFFAVLLPFTLWAAHVHRDWPCDHRQTLEWCR